jgi:hypothetical protein
MNPSNHIGENRTERQAADIRLETDSLHLMSRLEQLLAMLVDPELGGPIKSSLCRSKEMIAEVLEFTADHVDPAAVESYSDRVRQICEKSRHIESNSKASFWNALSQNLTLKRHEAKTRQEAQRNAQRTEFSALGVELNELLEEMFSSWKQRYSDPERAAEWEETYRVFLEDFRVSWSRV